MTFRSRKDASWNDVKDKAYDLVTNGRVTIEEMSTYSILCTVRGYHGDYETYVNNNAKVTKDNPIDEANFFCTCAWGDLSNNGGRPHDGPESSGSVKSNNRMCSHAYAAYILLQQYRKLHRRRNS